MIVTANTNFKFTQKLEIIGPSPTRFRKTKKINFHINLTTFDCWQN